MISETCRNCLQAAFVLRRLGFADAITWGYIENSPNKDLLHGSHANCNKMSLCTNYSSELAWLTAGRPKRITVYMAHPIAGDFTKNVAGAIAWYRYLRAMPVQNLMELTGVYYPTRPLISAPYLAGIEPDSSDHYPRERAMVDCRDMVTLFDEMWMMVSVSSGMKEEAGNAKVIRDLTHLGKLPPIPKQLNGRSKRNSRG